MKYTYNFFRSVMDVAPPGSFGSDAVTVVSGLLRSGTSMMMSFVKRFKCQ
jgi:hypothetical protein